MKQVVYMGERISVPDDAVRIATDKGGEVYCYRRKPSCIYGPGRWHNGLTMYDVGVVHYMPRPLDFDWSESAVKISELPPVTLTHLLDEKIEMQKKLKQLDDDIMVLALTSTTQG